MNRHFGSAGADKRLALQGRHEVISLLWLGFCWKPLYFSLFPDVSQRGLSPGSEFQKLSLDHSLALAGRIWDQSPAALPRQSDTTQHSQRPKKTKTKSCKCCLG